MPTRGLRDTSQAREATPVALWETSEFRCLGFGALGPPHVCPHRRHWLDQTQRRPLHLLMLLLLKNQLYEALRLPSRPPSHVQRPLAASPAARWIRCPRRQRRYGQRLLEQPLASYCRRRRSRASHSLCAYRVITICSAGRGGLLRGGRRSGHWTLRQRRPRSCGE